MTQLSGSPSLYLYLIIWTLFEDVLSFRHFSTVDRWCTWTTMSYWLCYTCYISFTSAYWIEWITSWRRVKPEKIVPHYSTAARLLWVPSLSAVGLLCPLLVQMLHSHVDFHSEGWPWPILCQLEPIAHTASFTFFLCSSAEWQTPRPRGSPPPRSFGFKAQCVWLANWKRRSFFFFFVKTWATLNLFSIPICGQSGSSSLQSLASHWQPLLCLIEWLAK